MKKILIVLLILFLTLIGIVAYSLFFLVNQENLSFKTEYGLIDGTTIRENHIEFLSDKYRTQFSKVANDAFHSRYSESTSTVSFQESLYNNLKIKEWFNRNSTTELDLAEIVLSEKASEKDKKFTKDLLKDVFNTIKSASDDESAYKALEKVISRHETLILSEKWNSNERFALGALAVAKHSTQFWKNYDFSVFSTPNTTAMRNPRSSIVVGADVAGYVVGGVVGGVGGSFAGPAGTVGGVFGGKAAGAWIGSGAAATALAIYDAWSDFFN